MRDWRKPKCLSLTSLLGFLWVETGTGTDGENRTLFLETPVVEQSILSLDKLKHEKKTAENKPVFDPNLHIELVIKDEIQDLGSKQY